PKPEKINSTLVFPNPATDHIHVLCRDFLQAPFRAQLFDLSGRNVVTQTFSANNFDMPLHNIREGLYVFRLFDAHGNIVITKKILVVNK
ncbi:MAG: T9SS type A sorting domain-containing protein, partial [Puia sp.]